MQSSTVFALAAVVVIVLLAVVWPRGAAPRQAAASGATAQLKVDGMACGACSARVERIALQVEGVQDAVVHLEEGHARIVYDPARTTPSAVAQRIADAGFKTGVLP
ncbi:MAG: heavy-metal-associated domain-containing protein [Dehalococcoidia bacterium]